VGLRTVSVVVPAYNEATRLEATLRAIVGAADVWDLEIVVVDDGSTDGTADVAASALEGVGRVQIIRLASNQGKGAAVRAGVLSTTGQAVVYMDADLATDLSALGPAIAALGTADVVVGSRVADGASVRDGTWLRTVMAFVFNGLVHLSTGLEFKDTQCGFKAFRGDVGRECFGLSRSRGFAFDVEVLVLARRLGYTMVEVPVRWTAVKGSSVRPIRDSLQMLVDLTRIVARWTPRRTRRAVEGGATSDPATDGPVETTNRS